MGQKKYKEFLAVNKMAKRIQKSNLACVEVPMWEISQGPHFDELQKLLESFWLPDLTTADNLILKYDLIVIPDPVLAKYLVEAYYLKETKMAKKKEYYEKLMKQPWGVVDAYPPKERMEWYVSHNLLCVALMTDSDLACHFCWHQGESQELAQAEVDSKISSIGYYRRGHIQTHQEPRTGR